MEKRTEVPFHLYLGCDVLYFENGVNVGFGVNTHELHVNIAMGIRKTEVKLLLRRLESLTEQEDQIEFPKHNRGNRIDEHWYPEGFLWLLSKGFDLFDLLPSNLAIDKNK